MTPRSWKEALRHKNIDDIVEEEHDDEIKYYILIPETVYNPWTETMGGGFFVSSFRELQQSIDWD
tara:strand:- start:43 stop:237 length:195 start_codon:yes stop_codon:yes gene_type:complete